MNDITRTSKEQVEKPYWIPDNALRRMMRECEQSPDALHSLQAHVLKGICADLLDHRSAHEPPAEQLPSAWIKGHTLHTDAGIEYDEEVVPGSDRPKGDGWHPLYSRPSQPPPEGQFAIGESVRVGPFHNGEYSKVMKITGAEYYCDNEFGPYSPSVIVRATSTKRSARDPRCDCQNPEPVRGPAMRSMTCPIHNDLPADSALGEPDGR